MEFRILTPLIIAAFAWIIEPVGLVPAVFTATVVACMADLKVHPVMKLVLGTMLSLLTWAIFIGGLRLTIPAFAWPF